MLASKITCRRRGEGGGNQQEKKLRSRLLWHCAALLLQAVHCTSVGGACGMFCLMGDTAPAPSSPPCSEACRCIDAHALCVGAATCLASGPLCGVSTSVVFSTFWRSPEDAMSLFSPDALRGRCSGAYFRCPRKRLRVVCVFLYPDKNRCAQCAWSISFFVQAVRRVRAQTMIVFRMCYYFDKTGGAAKSMFA